MKRNLFLIYFCFLFTTIRPNLYLTMKLEYIDDCITKIYYENNTIIYEKQNYETQCIMNEQVSDNPIVDSLSYKIGQKIYFEIKDTGGGCAIDITIYLNEYTIESESRKFWRCENCDGDQGNYVLFNGDIYYYCYSTNRDESKFYYFFFQINNLSDLSELNIQTNGISRSNYFLTQKKDFFIYVSNLDEKIDLINLNDKNNLYSKKNDIIIEPIYELLIFKFYHIKINDNYGKFFNFFQTDNDISNELNVDNFYNIAQKKGLRYEMTESEKFKNGTYLKLNIRIFDHHHIFLTDKEFNFFICLDVYKICDINSSMKCLNEGYYSLNDLYYSCYETCKTCDTFHKPNTADYIHNYCDSCKSNYPYFINITDENNKSYKSCFNRCPNIAPYLKEINSDECISDCPKYKTNDYKCVEKCDSKIYKYLLKIQKTCYNYIPKDYFIYIDDSGETYENSNKSTIIISDKCPDESYDSSFKNLCIKLDDDIFHLITNPNELIDYNNPFIKILKTKNLIIRAYSKNSKIEEMEKYDNKLYKIDIIPFENILKEKNIIGKEESIIIYDVNNLDNENYLYKIYSSEGKEFDRDILLQNNITKYIVSYFQLKELNKTKCSKEYPYYDKKNNKCIKFCDITDFFDKICVTDIINKENINYNINHIKRSIEYHEIDSILDSITKGEESKIIEEKGIKYQLSSTSNQNNKIYDNISNIYLGKCEYILKQKYNIDLNISLLVFKVDINIEGYSTPIVEYEIYHPITKKKLDLIYCNENKINISIPVNINEHEVAKYDPKSEFYNDICSIYTTPYNTDITLNDRQNEFIENNMTLCDNDCNFIEYNNYLKKVKCECDIKFNIKDIYNIKIDKKKLKLKFNIKNLINIKVLKCYKKLFCKDGIVHNICSYILISTILIYIFSLFILLLKEFKFLMNDIKLFLSRGNNSTNKNKHSFINSVLNKKITKKNNKKSQESTIGKECDIPSSSKGKMFLNIQQNKKKIDKLSKVINNKKDTNKNFTKNEKITLNDYELNNSEYNIALKYDKRKCLYFFYSLLKINHPLFFVIIPSKDYNSKIIKLCLFIFSFSFQLTNKALFFNEETIHNIYKNKGVYDIIYQIPQIIYSSIISISINAIIKYLSLSQKYIIEEKRKINDNNKIVKINSIKNNLKVKFLLFYIFSFLLLFFFWYYISCFCAVYKNTQLYLIKDTLISFGISLIYPVVSYLISGLLRICSLKKKSEYIYKFSKIIIL